jgi:hypothetical protein
MTDSSFMQKTVDINGMSRTPMKKTVTLKPEAYDFLVSQGKKNQTFTDIVLSLKERLS